ncbi:MAG: DNA adenine methylase [Blastocatellia bacterium]
MSPLKKTSKPIMLNSPFKWVGGKSRLRKYIIPLITPHSCFVDLFAGAGWVLFGKSPSKIEVLNDKDEDLITFFRVVKEKPQELIASFDWDLVSRAEFERLASLNPSTMTDIERAHRFYYLIMAGWGGELAYPRFQTSINDGGHGNRLFGAIKNLHARIEPIHKRLSTIIIENLSWQKCFEQYDSPNTFFYIDPPYPGNKCNYTHNMKNWPEHYELYEKLKSSKSRWIISSYDIPEIHELFDDPKYFIIPVSSYSGMNVDKEAISRVQNKEVLLLNFKPINLPSEIKIPSQKILLEGTIDQGSLPF